MWLMELPPGDLAMPAERLRLAVPGLVGIAGLVLFPTLAAWGRILIELLESDRSGIGPPRRLSGLSVIKAVMWTFVLSFFLLTAIRAASELREVQAEAPVIAWSVQGLLIGIAFWAIYALGISALKTDAQRQRSGRRMSRLR